MILPLESDGCELAPLHVRSGYSLLRGPSSLERVIAGAAAKGYRRLALTDVNNLYGVTFFWKRAVAAGLSPVVGAELLEGEASVVALVAGDEGYENLCQLITRVQCRQKADVMELVAARREEAGHADLPRRSKGGGGGTLSADLGERSAGLHLIVEQDWLARGLLEAGVESGRLWLGVDGATQTHAQLRRLAECGRSAGLGLVATGKAFMVGTEDGESARLLAAIRTGAMMDSVGGVELPHARAVLRDAATLRRELEAFPEAMANNERLARECSGFRLLPRRPVFPDYRCPDGLAVSAYLRKLCEEGLWRRYGEDVPAGAEARLAHELERIGGMGFSEYFLVVWDIVQYARRQGAPVAGRGSGASSLVAYLLGITNVCPLAYGMPFERFLNEYRTDFPDLDVDFCWRIRDDVIDYAFGRWGASHVAMVSMHGTFQDRSAVRETAKALGMSNEQVTRAVSRVEAGAGGLRGAGGAMARVGRLAAGIMHLPHHLSVHPGGIVIGRKPINHYVPLEPAAKGVMIAQLDKNGVEDINLVKLDLLGNRSLSTIRCATDLIRRRRGESIDIESLGVDEATIGILQRGQTVGCNQLESPAMRHLLRMMQPRELGDVMKALALIRPGAASIGMKEVFIRRQRGMEEVPAGPGAVEEILRPSHGVMLYEDDVMLVGAAMLGGSLGVGDRFRKSVQKCHDDRQRLELSRQFLDGCVKNGVDVEFAKSMWVQMAKFNAYSFCRAHAASYAVLAYAGAYLKAHYPLEFWCSAMNNNQSMYPIRCYVEQAKRSGVEFLLPDANRSGEEFAIEEMDEAALRPGSGQAGLGGLGAIRVGLNRIGGLGPSHIERILQARLAGPFEGLSDFLARTGLGREPARAMILCGAFDSTGRRRPALMLELELFLSTQMGRIWQGRSLMSIGATMPVVPGDFEPMRKYMEERQILGLCVGEHLMGLYRPLLEGRVSIDSRAIEASVGRRVRIAGVVEAMRSAQTQGGGAMMFATLDDEYGLYEVTVFPDALRNVGGVLGHYGPYIVSGRVEEQYGAITISAERIELVAKAELEEQGAGEEH